MIPADVGLDLELFPAHLHIDLLPEAQGQGLGRALMRDAAARLVAEGVPGIHLAYDPANVGAAAFYDRLGWRPVSPGNELGARDRAGAFAGLNRRESRRRSGPAPLARLALMADEAAEIEALERELAEKKAALAAKQDGEGRAPAIRPRRPAPEGPLDADQIATIKAGYSFDAPALEMGALVNGEPLPDVPVRIPIAMMNRHGLVAGRDRHRQDQDAAGARRAAVGCRGSGVRCGYQGRSLRHRVAGAEQ